MADRARMKPETDAFFISEQCHPLSRKTAWLRSEDRGVDAAAISRGER
jgi:hypothetical protein